MALLIVVTANSDRPFAQIHRACIWETTLVTFRNNMASNVPKRESLSRYFTDLEEYESDSDDSSDEVNRVEKTSDRKINNLVPQLGVSSGRADDSKVTARNNIVAENAQKKLIAVDGNSNTAAKQENKLPSALDCLNSKSIPNFLKLRAKKEVDWDFCEKRLDGDETTEYVSNAVPPPSSYEPVIDLGTKVVDSEGRKRKTIGKQQLSACNIACLSKKYVKISAVSD